MSFWTQSSRWKKLERPLSIAEAVAAEAAPVEEVDLEAALGGGIRKAPAVVAALDEAEVAEG
jgi:small subunit ribosomal protein S2